MELYVRVLFDVYVESLYYSARGPFMLSLFGLARVLLL